MNIKIQGEKMKNNKIFADELKRTFPIYMIGIIFRGLTIYILYKIPEFIGNILIFWPFPF